MIKQTINNTFKHLKRVRTHRKWVRHYCWKTGLYWQGLVHDLSKYSPAELFESIKYYNDKGSPINAAKADKGYSSAWFHHKGCNKHHYEYWMDNFDQGGENILMPRKYFLEMICDYLGANRAYNPNSPHPFQDENKWWQQKRIKCGMCIELKDTLSVIFDMLAKAEKIGGDPEWYLSHLNEYYDQASRAYHKRKSRKN